MCTFFVSQSGEIIIVNITPFSDRLQFRIFFIHLRNRLKYNTCTKLHIVLIMAYTIPEFIKGDKGGQHITSL